MQGRSGSSPSSLAMPDLGDLVVRQPVHDVEHQRDPRSRLAGPERVSHGWPLGGSEISSEAMTTAGRPSAADALVSRVEPTGRA